MAGLVAGPAAAQTTRPAAAWGALLPMPPIKACTVNLIEPGVYDGFLLRRQHSGTIEHPTVIRARQPGTVVIMPRSPLLCGVYSPDDEPAYCVEIDGLTAAGASVDGFRFFGGTHVRLRNCLADGNLKQGIGLFESRDCVVEACEVRGNGFSDSSGHSHGIYASGYGLVIRDCLVKSNAGSGVHVWLRNSVEELDKTPRPHVRDNASCQIVNNVIYGHQRGSGVVLQRYGTADAAGTIAGNVVVANLRGICLYGAAGERLEGNRVIGNAERSIAFYGHPPGPVLLTGNVVDLPVADEYHVATRPADHTQFETGASQ